MRLKPRQFRKPRLSYPLARGLIGLWLFNEGGGSLFYDLSNNAHAGTLEGGTIFVPGKFGPVVRLFAVDTFLTPSDPHNQFDFMNTPCTVLAWVKTNAGADDGSVVNSWGLIEPNKQQWILRYESTNPHFLFGLGGESNSFFIADGPNNSTPVGIWHQVVGVKTGDDVVKIYTNGVLSADQPAITQTLNPYTGIRIGENLREGTHYNGFIDHILIWDREVSASEIAQLHLAPFAIFERDPIELWVGSVGAGAPPEVSVPVIYHHYQIAAGAA